MYFSSLVVELLSNISEIAGSNPSSYIYAFFFKPKWCSSVIVYQEQGHACVHFVLCFYQTKSLDPLCEDVHCARAPREN